MEAAVPNRIARSASRFRNHHVLTGDRSSIYRGRCPNLTIPMAMAAAAPGKGGGVLDRPIEKITPGRQSELNVKKSRKMTPPYRVILHNDNYNRREYVVQVLMKVIPGMTLDNAVNIMEEAHVNGLSVVIICSQSEPRNTARRSGGMASEAQLNLQVVAAEKGSYFAAYSL